MKRITTSLKCWTSNHPLIFPFLAFIIPLTVRVVPELLAGPYLLGFDTQAFYVPNVLLWMHNGVNFLDFLGTAPLLYAIILGIARSGGSMVLSIKVISPLLLALLAFSIYLFARKSISWSAPKSLFVAVLGTVYFVALRASWDQLREEVSLVFLFVVLTLLFDRKNRSLKGYALLSLAMLAVVFSDQVGAVIMMGVVVFTLISDLFYRRFFQAFKLTLSFLTAAIYFIVAYLTGISAVFSNLGYSNVVSPLASWSGFTSYPSQLFNEATFFLYCFLPLLPLVIISFWKLGNPQLRSWLVVSLILLLSPISASPYRWILMLVYPLAFYSTEALSRLKEIKLKKLRFKLQKIAILYLVLSTAILSFGFMFMTAENSFPYFSQTGVNSFIYQIPSSMLQNTISISDCKSTVNALQWCKNNIGSSAVLMTHTAFYGWALLILNETQVMDYQFANPSSAAQTLVHQGLTQIYIIWWVNGKGWYGELSLPLSFREVYQSGEIAIYRYDNSA